jgi:hypothetical protein
VEIGDKRACRYAIAKLSVGSMTRGAYLRTCLFPGSSARCSAASFQSSDGKCSEPLKRLPDLHGAIAVRRDEVRNVRNTALNGAAVRRFADPEMNRYVPFSNFEDSRDVTNKGLRGHLWPPISWSSESSQSSML